ncbi:endocytosis defective- protein [Coemansia sp. RSA 552]|nr:endocytosis defective- protein [Coemansia sp. RSA 552]
MNSLTVSPEERQQFQQHFYNAGPVDGKLPGSAARQSLMQSGLPTQQLGEVWELADIDKDGALDLEEYCIALKLVFSLLNRAIDSVPPVLPPSLIPQGKYGHFTSTATDVLSSGGSLHQLAGSPQVVSPNAEMEWYIPNEERARYQGLFSQHTGGSQVRFLDVDEFLGSLGLPRPTITQAWSLVDVRKYQELNQQQFVYLMHVLSSHLKGTRIPAVLPPAVKDAIYSSLNLNSTGSRTPEPASHGYRYGKPSSTAAGDSRKPGLYGERSGNVALADSYLSKLKTSSTFKNEPGSRYASSSKRTEEEKRLKAELKGLDEELERLNAESTKAGSGAEEGGLGAALKELEELKEHKLQEKQGAEDRNARGPSNSDTGESLQDIKQSIFQLEGHLSFLQSEKRAMDEFMAKGRQELLDLQMEQVKLK